MAIDLQVSPIFEEVFGDYYCIGRHRVLQYEADMGVSGASFIGDLVNINFFMWGSSVGQINQPVPVSYGELPEGYNIIVPSSNTGWIELDMSYSGAPTWKNYKVEADIYTSGLVDFKITFMHTMDMKSWIADKQTRDNNRRYWRSKWNDTTEFNVSNGSFYQVDLANLQWLGVRISRYNIVNEQYVLAESAVLADPRSHAYFWNPTVPNDPLTEPPYSPVKNYSWELSRTSKPVLNFSTVQDTHVKFKIESHPLDPDQAYDTWYSVGLVKIDAAGDNNERFMDDLPSAYATAYSGNYLQEEMFPHQINGSDVVKLQTNFTNTSGNFYECEFDVPKEVIDAGATYRFYVIVWYYYNIVF